MNGPHKENKAIHDGRNKHLYLKLFSLTRSLLFLNFNIDVIILCWLAMFCILASHLIML